MRKYQRFFRKEGTNHKNTKGGTVLRQKAEDILQEVFNRC